MSKTNMTNSRDQLPASTISLSSNMTLGDDGIKQYTQSGSYRCLNEDSLPYTKTPVFQFKSSSSFGSNRHRSPTNDQQSSPPNHRRATPTRKLGRQNSRLEFEHQIGNDDLDNVGDCVKPTSASRATSPRVCWSGEQKSMDANQLAAGAGTRRKNGSVHSSESGSEANSVTSRRVLAATAFVWLPLCRPTQKVTADSRDTLKKDMYYQEAHKCTRLRYR